MNRACLVVFAKRPEAGLVKTRMCPPFTPQEACALYAALLDDALETSAAAAAAFDLDLVLAVQPPDACRDLAQGAPAGFRVVAQRGADLARRMAWAVDEAAAGGATPILLRGSDSPLLRVEEIGAALRALDSHDLFVRPDRDGGYDLIGLRRPSPGLFDHPMSTASVLEDTLANAARAGLRAFVADEGFDLDTAEDLALLAAARAEGGAAACPRTLAFLDENDLWERAARISMLAAPLEKR